MFWFWSFNSTFYQYSRSLSRYIINIFFYSMLWNHFCNYVLLFDLLIINNNFYLFIICVSLLDGNITNILNGLMFNNYSWNFYNFFHLLSDLFCNLSFYWYLGIFNLRFIISISSCNWNGLNY